MSTDARPGIQYLNDELAGATVWMAQSLKLVVGGRFLWLEGIELWSKPQRSSLIIGNFGHDIRSKSSYIE